MSQQYHRSPSQILSIPDEYYAWCIDEAVFHYGSSLEHQMQQGSANAKTGDARSKLKSAILQRYLAMSISKSEEEEAPKASQFRDPAALFKKG